MLRNFVGVVIGVIAWACPLQSARAEPTTAVGQWFCDVLKEPFDATAAMRAFPLEKLGAPKQTRRIDDDTVHVEIAAEGLDYTVTYSYAFNQDDVDRRYGFDLSVEFPQSGREFRQMAMEWLIEFGAPVKTTFGHAVEVGPAMMGGSSPFSFGFWNSGRIIAEWFYERDLRRAAGACANAKPAGPAPDVFAGIITGPAVDRRTDPVAQWFCTLLKPGFNPDNAFSTFPLERLPAPKTERKSEDDSVNVSVIAAGDSYEVQYRYSYLTDDVDDRYGFGLYVQPVSAGENVFEESMTWLRGFGTPEEGLLGFQVGAGPPDFMDDRPFKFAVWETIGTRSAHWFEERDIIHAAKLCA